MPPLNQVTTRFHIWQNYNYYYYYIVILSLIGIMLHVHVLYFIRVKFLNFRFVNNTINLKVVHVLN